MRRASEVPDVTTSPDHLHQAEQDTALPSAYVTILSLADRVPNVPSSPPRSLKHFIETRGGPEMVIIDYALKSLDATIRTRRMYEAPLRVIEACQRLAGWADFCREPRTALAIVRAAIKLNSDRLEFRAGQVAARQGRRALAIALFEAAIRYATEVRDWTQVANGWTQLGRQHLMDMAYADAEKAHASALRVARKHGLKKQEAEALHNLAQVAIDQRDRLTALMYARLALQAYGDSYGSISLLANDVAYFWMDTDGDFDTALELFEASLPHAQSALDKMDILANIALASAGKGNAAKFDEASKEVEAIGNAIPFHERFAGALLELARGAYLLDRSEDAIRITIRARQMAHSRSETKYVEQADRLLDRLRKGDPIFVASAPSLVARAGNRDLADRLTLLLRSNCELP